MFEYIFSIYVKNSFCSKQSKMSSSNATSKTIKTYELNQEMNIIRGILESDGKMYRIFA